MTGASGLSSINCTQCGAGLSVLGGGRVLSHVCGYCGAVLDAQDNYKILSSIGARDHPDSPFHIGHVVHHEDVPFTVIGTLGLVERWAGNLVRWTEHQLFSPTHGYAWVSFESGHVTFSRKVREQSRPSFITPAQVESAENPPTVRLGSEGYRYFESGTKEIDFIEGEFNWLPEMGRRSTYVSLMSRDAMLTFVDTGSEYEVERTVLMDQAAVAQDLGVTLPRPGRMHPLTPYVPVRHEKFMRDVLMGCAILALLCAMLIWSSGSRVLDVANVNVRQLPESYSFPISSTQQLVEVRLASTLENAWAVLSTEITDPDGQPVAVAERLVERYSGRSGSDSWSEGSARASYRFRPSALGTYQITLDQEEADRWPNSGRPNHAVSLRVTERVPSPIYLLGAAFLFGVGLLAVAGRRAVHHTRRWRGTDWND